jgi:Xaa-Pro aminopeptidase
MEREHLDAYIVPSADPHQSEYPPPYWKEREWITGFRGSAGTAVIMHETAGLWTDSRYYLEAEKAVEGSYFELHRVGQEGVADYPEYVADRLPTGATVGFCAHVLSEAARRRLESQLKERGLESKPTADLIGEIWRDRPRLPRQPVFEHSLSFAGQSRREKLARVRRLLEDRGCDWAVLASLDDIAWLFNLRGSDVDYNPVFLSFAAVGPEKTVLCVDPSKIAPQLADSLRGEGVHLAAYDDLSTIIDSIPAEAAVACDPQRMGVSLYRKIKSSHTVRDGVNPTTVLKAAKTPEELANLRRCMVRDGAAMVEFLYWLSEAPADGQLSEYAAMRKLREIRSGKDHFVSESFNTISAFGSNAPIVHYRAPEEGSAEIRRPGLYLLDSGGQYLDGTTDITRTIAVGSPDGRQKQDFTLVLKAHIALATARFPRGTTGHELDSLCRRPMWDERANYGHGTGHGVGYFLNVHEGPQRISPTPNSVSLEEGMLISNEPGIYRAGEYGIRIENLLAVRSEGRGDFGPFLSFETLTLCPIDRTLVDSSLLTALELHWLNEYHNRVYEALAPSLSASCREWLRHATEYL